MFNKVYLGDRFINKIYLGDTLIKYNLSPPPPVSYTNLSSVILDGEVKILNGDGQIIRSVPISAYKVIIDSEQNLYCCTDNTICKYDANNKKIYEIPASKTNVGAAFRESTNTLIAFENNNIQFIDVKSNLIMKYPFTDTVEAIDVAYSSDIFVTNRSEKTRSTVTIHQFNQQNTIEYIEPRPIKNTIFSKLDHIHYILDGWLFGRGFLYLMRTPPYTQGTMWTYEKVGEIFGSSYNGTNALMMTSHGYQLFYPNINDVTSVVEIKTNMKIKTKSFVSIDVDDNGDFYCFFTENGKYIKIDGRTGDILWEKLNCATDYLAYVQKTK